MESHVRLLPVQELRVTVEGPGVYWRARWVTKLQKGYGLA
jgi:hypothetical protein